MENSSNLNLLLTEMAKILRVENVDPDISIGQLGIDSLNVIELILACQQIYEDGVDFENIDFTENTTSREIDQTMSEVA